MEILLIRIIKIGILVSLTLYSAISLALNTDDESINEMCNLNQKFFKFATQAGLPSGEQKLTGDMKTISERINTLMDGDYSAPVNAISTFQGLERSLNHNENAIVITFSQYEANTKVLFGHTLKNPHVERELTKHNVIYADISSGTNKDSDDRFKMLSHLKIFTQGVIFSKNINEAREQEIGFRNECVTPSNLLKWLQKINSSKNSLKQGREKASRPLA